MIFVDFTFSQRRLAYFKLQRETPLEKKTYARGGIFSPPNMLSLVDICSKMGRVGENGSEEVAVFYAKKAVEETKETEKALKVLGLAIE
jgi:hypothetical protein